MRGDRGDVVLNGVPAVAGKRVWALVELEVEGDARVIRLCVAQEALRAEGAGLWIDLWVVVDQVGTRQQCDPWRVLDLPDLDGPLRVRLYGKGDQWRSCPLWPVTVDLLKQLETVQSGDKTLPLFTSHHFRPLTRFGIYKLVKRHTRSLDTGASGRESNGVSPHVFRHSLAVGLLEQGVDVNVIRGWLGHVSLDTTHRYAEINLRTKQAAVTACLPPVDSSDMHRSTGGWHKDQDLMKWLRSL